MSVIKIMTDFSKLKRKRYSIPEDVKKALLAGNVMGMYRARPPYQQNDYIGWIIRAAREKTRQNRINQMVDELKRGNVYMKMKWSPKKV